MGRPWTNPAHRFMVSFDWSPECWIWKREKIYSGYGRLSIGKRHFLAHRLSWMIHNGQIPSDKQVLHKCNVRACVNPDHLYLGTHTDNMRDAVASGFCGEKKPHSKLTDSKVREIRANLASGTTTKQALAERYGVSTTVIRWVGQGRIWKHVSDECPIPNI